MRAGWGWAGLEGQEGFIHLSGPSTFHHVVFLPSWGLDRTGVVGQLDFLHDSRFSSGDVPDGEGLREAGTLLRSSLRSYSVA